MEFLEPSAINFLQVLITESGATISVLKNPPKKQQV